MGGGADVLELCSRDGQLQTYIWNSTRGGILREVSLRLSLALALLAGLLARYHLHIVYGICLSC